MKKTATVSGKLSGLRETAALESIAALANIRDEKARAVSFYFSWSSFSDRSHHEELLNVKHLVSRAKSEFQSAMVDPGLSKDLARILNMEGRIRENPARFRAVFACASKDIWQEFDLPAYEGVSRLGIGRHFQLVPLLRALELCTPYCVAVVEHGKARVFVTRGAEIREVVGQFPSVDLSVNADDSRVGWSHHIDANVNARAKAYMKGLAFDLHQFMESAHCRYLVIGCRADLWSEFEPQVVKAGVAPMVAGHFHLSSFDLTPKSVQQAAKPVFEKRQRQHYANLWKSIHEEPAQSAVGVDRVLQCLDSGRVQKLLLGDISDTNVTECANCNKWQLKAVGNCVACGSCDIFATPADELLSRKALSTNAEILAPDTATAHLFGGVGAILRY